MQLLNVYQIRNKSIELQVKKPDRNQLKHKTKSRQPAKKVECIRKKEGERQEASSRFKLCKTFQIFNFTHDKFEKPDIGHVA